MCSTGNVQASRVVVIEATGMGHGARCGIIFAEHICEISCCEKVSDTDLGDIVRWLWAVTPHVDLLQGVGDLLLLQLQPHFLAVGTPENKRG